jgi:hypothetical protein
MSASVSLSQRNAIRHAHMTLCFEVKSKTGTKVEVEEYYTLPRTMFEQN